MDIYIYIYTVYIKLVVINVYCTYLNVIRLVEMYSRPAAVSYHQDRVATLLSHHLNWLIESKPHFLKKLMNVWWMLEHLEATALTLAYIVMKCG